MFTLCTIAHMPFHLWSNTYAMHVREQIHTAVEGLRATAAWAAVFGPSLVSWGLCQCGLWFVVAYSFTGSCAQEDWYKTQHSGSLGEKRNPKLLPCCQGYGSQLELHSLTNRWHLKRGNGWSVDKCFEVAFSAPPLYIRGSIHLHTFC